jgi:hypothetical protein
MGASIRLPLERGLGKTDRIDAWWRSPLAMGTYLGIMLVYATWRGFMEAEFWIFTEFGRSGGTQTMAIETGGSHVLSPLFSPLIIPGKDGLGSFVPSFLHWMSPAMFILIFPAGFRGTCYYYRKAYYRSFFASPAACAVSTPHDEYAGETRLFLFQNLHRFFMYAAVIYLFVLSWDVIMAGQWHLLDGSGKIVDSGWQVSVGTLVLLLNVVLLTGYTLGCHSLRHLIGGIRNRFRGSAGAVAEACWTNCTKLNKNHNVWAITSLFWVMFSDFYVYICSEGWWGMRDVVLIGGVGGV